MGSKAKIMVLASCLLLLISCAKSSDEKPAPGFTADIERSIGQPRSAFKQENQEMKLQSLSASEVSELMACNIKSSAGRADKQKFSVGYGMLGRSVNNGEISIAANRYDYSTENKEEVYNVTTSMIEYILFGRPVLTNGGITYVDLCTASAGCDQEKRNFIVGSPSYLISTKAHEAKVTEEIRLAKNNTDCSIKTETDSTEQIQPGLITMGETSYKAVQLEKKRMGKIYCVAGSFGESFYLGEGVEVSKTIFLKDQLATGSYFSQRIANVKTLGCQRSIVFSSNEIQFEGKTIQGSSSEMVDYQYTGKITSIEDWKKEQDAIKSQIAKLKNDITIAKSTMDRAQSAVAEADSELRTSESKLADAKRTLDAAIVGKLPSEEVARTQVKLAEEDLEKARKRSEAAKAFLVNTQLQNKTAEDALASYVKTNGTGESIETVNPK